MLTPISVTFKSEKSEIYQNARSGSAYSIESQTLRKNTDRVIESIERSFALFGLKADSISRIWRLVDECAELDWDGYAASPVSRLAALLAAEFVRALPVGVPLPEFAPEPDGSISLDWEGSMHRSITMSSGHRGRFAYAWIDGSNTGRGVFKLDRGRIPSPVLGVIREIMNA